MPVAWYIIPYKRRVGSRRPRRYVEIDDYTSQIRAAGGDWSETEVLGNRALVKVRASAGILAALNDVPGFRRIPKDRLDDSLSDLSAGVKTALRNEIFDMGYTVSEVQDKFGSDLGAYTLRDVLRFMTRRRRKPRYDSGADEIVLDGLNQPCRDIDSVDFAVTEDSYGISRDRDS